jgi:sterol 24-C-methyltransferase
MSSMYAAAGLAVGGSVASLCISPTGFRQMFFPDKTKAVKNYLQVIGVPVPTPVLCSVHWIGGNVLAASMLHSSMNLAFGLLVFMAGCYGMSICHEESLVAARSEKSPVIKSTFDVPFAFYVAILILIAILDLSVVKMVVGMLILLVVLMTYQTWRSKVSADDVTKEVERPSALLGGLARAAIVASFAVLLVPLAESSGVSFAGAEWENSVFATALRVFGAGTKTDRGLINAYEQRYAKGDELADQFVTNAYYDLATDFYEYGWGRSFHFSTRFRGESFKMATKRHEYHLASKLGLSKGQKVLDLGMGVGGPLREIAMFSGAEITGVTINAYQVRRANQITKSELGSAVAEKCCRYVQSDFTDLREVLPQNGTFDAVYYIESSCHLEDRIRTFSEAFRLLKPGGRLFSYEWVMTDRYNAEDPEHEAIRKAIEHGNGLPRILHRSEPLEHLRRAGFEVLDHYDLVDTAAEVYADRDLPWYSSLQAGYSLEGFLHTNMGRTMTHTMTVVLEFIGLAPAGTVSTSAMLEDGADGLVKGGETGIFTPMYAVLARKPSN